MEHDRNPASSKAIQVAAAGLAALAMLLTSATLTGCARGREAVPGLSSGTSPGDALAWSPDDDGRTWDDGPLVDTAPPSGHDGRHSRTLPRHALPPAEQPAVIGAGKDIYGVHCAVCLGATGEGGGEGGGAAGPCCLAPWPATTI
jgi:hypothetical protein